MARNDDDERQSAVQYLRSAEQRERRRDSAHFQEMVRQWRTLHETGARDS